MTLQFLIQKYLDRTLTEGEKVSLARMLEQPAYQLELAALIDEGFVDWQEIQQAPDADMLYQKIVQRNKALEQDDSNELYGPRKAYDWLPAVAAALVLFLAGAYFLFLHKKEEPAKTATTSKTAPPPAPADIPPGGDKATLTLANGTTIVLDSAENGILTQQGTTTINKRDGLLTYNSIGVTTNISYNTLSTPRGGQYQLTLPDGSNVWLNAASSIKYPTAFSGTERQVDITGEVYFEVAKNTRRPFKVYAKGQRIDVLGTSFNINAYANEPEITTTLIKGSIKVKTRADSIVLKPGQQAISTNPAAVVTTSTYKLLVSDLTNPEPAWKDNQFRFSNTEVATVMRQLERWYNITVHYEAGVPDIKIIGEAPRTLPLSNIIRLLQLSHVKLKLQNNQLTVLKQ